MTGKITTLYRTYMFPFGKDAIVWNISQNSYRNLLGKNELRIFLHIYFLDVRVPFSSNVILRSVHVYNYINVLGVYIARDVSPRDIYIGIYVQEFCCRCVGIIGMGGQIHFKGHRKGTLKISFFWAQKVWISGLTPSNCPRKGYPRIKIVLIGMGGVCGMKCIYFLPLTPPPTRGTKCIFFVPLTPSPNLEINSEV